MLEYFDSLFADHTWEHYDQFIDSDSSYDYVDANWDEEAIQEDLIERKRTVNRALARAMQKNGVLHRELGLPKQRVKIQRSVLLQILQIRQPKLSSLARLRRVSPEAKSGNEHYALARNERDVQLPSLFRREGALIVREPHRFLRKETSQVKVTPTTPSTNASPVPIGTQDVVHPETIATARLLSKWNPRLLRTLFPR